MTSEAERPLDRLTERAEAVLVDFDGPICRLFGSKAAPRIAADLRQLIVGRGVVLPDELRDGDDPLELFRATGVFAPELVGVVGAALAAAEVEAAASAETTIGAFDVVGACLATGRPSPSSATTPPLPSTPISDAATGPATSPPSSAGVSTPIC